jgi:GT2 family glycosyltransferase
MPTVPLVSFVIPVRNDARRLQRCLESIRNAEYPADRIELIVADNGSTDESAAIAVSLGARVLSLPDRRVAEIRNLAAQASCGEVIAFVDADHEIVSGWVPSAIETLQREGVAAVGDQYHAPPHGTWVQRQYDRLRSRSTGVRDTSWLPSGNLAVWRRVFDAVDGFDAGLETCEDVEFCKRLRASGARVVSDQRLVSTHFGDPATLARLFMSELWRGRDNIRVTLRRPLTPREVTGLLVPIVELLLLGLTIVGLFTMARSGPWLALAAVAGILALSAAQSVRMLRSGAAINSVDGVQTFAVAGVYGIARAMALVVRASHQLRREGRG